MARPYTIYAVQTVDEAVELLTGVPAGEAEAGGDYPEGTMNARVVARLPGNLLKLLLEELHPSPAACALAPGQCYQVRKPSRHHEP